MIKLKLTGKDIKAFCIYMQRCIDLSRSEIVNGRDLAVHTIPGNKGAHPSESWHKLYGNRHVMKVAERHAHIDELEKTQRRLMLAYDKSKELRPKSVSISKAAGYFLLLYMDRIGITYQNDYPNLIMEIQSHTILKELI